VLILCAGEKGCRAVTDRFLCKLGVSFRSILGMTGASEPVRERGRVLAAEAAHTVKHPIRGEKTLRRRREGWEHLAPEMVHNVQGPRG